MDRLEALIKKFDDTPEQTPSPALGKVLVIDDDENIRQALERTLTQRNYEVIVTTNGQDGIEKMTDEIGVVLLDLKLPRMEGTEVYESLKQKQPEAPIIFYSAYPGDEKVAQKCLELEPYAFVEKGVSEDIDRLYSLIEKAVKERKDIGQAGRDAEQV